MQDGPLPTGGGPLARRPPPALYGPAPPPTPLGGTPTPGRPRGGHRLRGFVYSHYRKLSFIVQTTNYFYLNYRRIKQRQIVEN